MASENRAVRGRYRGQPLEDSTRRSVALRDRDGSGHSFFVDNFYHAGEFWTAEIPKNSVDQILGQSFNFSKVKTRKGPNGPETIFNEHGVPRRKVPGLNHLQTRFRLKTGKGVKLFALGSPENGIAKLEIDDFIYSIEAVGPPGVNFGIRDGLRGNLISAHRFLSTEEMVFERIVVENQYVQESPPLPIDNDDKQELLELSLERSHRAGMAEPYYLYRCCGTNNCTSNPLQLLDSVVEYSFRHRFGALLYRLPLRPRNYLRARGLDSDRHLRKLVRQEFADYISSKETQRRKRDYVRKKIKERRAAREKT